MGRIRNVRLLWNEDRDADKYTVQWGEGISGSTQSDASLFQENQTYLITGLGKSGVSDEITFYVDGSQTWPEGEKVVLFGFPSGRSGINSTSTFFDSFVGSEFQTRNTGIPNFPFEPTTGFATYGKQKRLESVKADHTYQSYSGEVYDITRSGSIITGHYSGNFTGLSTGDSVYLSGFNTGLITTGNFSGYADINNSYEIQTTGSGYFTVTGSGSDFITGEYTGANGYLVYTDRSSYSGELKIAQDFSLTQSVGSDDQTSYIWRVRSENLYSKSAWTYGQFFTENLPDVPSGAILTSPTYWQSGFSSSLERDNKISILVDWSGDQNADYYNIEYGNAWEQFQPSYFLHTNYNNVIGPITGESAYLFLDYGTGYSIRVRSYNYAGNTVGTTGIFFIQDKPESSVSYYSLPEGTEEEMIAVLDQAEYEFSQGFISGYDAEKLKLNVATGGSLNNYLYQGDIYSDRVTGFATGLL